MGHTPGPYIMAKSKSPDLRQREDYLIHTEDGLHIAEVFQYQNHENKNGPSEANSKFIVKACNAHDDLLEALTMACKVLIDNNLDESMAGEFEILTDALAKAKGIDVYTETAGQRITKATGE